MNIENTAEYVDWDAEIPVIRYKSLEDTGCVEHGFSTRLGGVSEGIYRSMNLSYTRGDRKEDVDENFRRFCKTIHMDWEKIVSTDQTHTANVRVVTEKDAGHGILRPKTYFDVDGQITNVPGLPLITYHADCVPLFFVDPVKKAIGLTHSGWRGTVNRIGKNTIEAMKATYSSRPEDIITVIGPSICKACYEVSRDVAEAFENNFNDSGCFIQDKGNGKYQLDLWEANRQIMLESGVLPEHITVTRWCTGCHPDLLWSHRKTGNRRGSLAAFLCLK
jgi:hypothetical protein